MHISDEGLVSGSVNRAELAAAYADATDPAVRANLAAVGAQNGMLVKGDELVEESSPTSEPEPAPEEPAEPESEEDESEPSPPAQADNKAAWVDWAVSQGATQEYAESSTKAELIDEYGG